MTKVTFEPFHAWDYINSREEFEEFCAAYREEISGLAARYDDALKRIADLEAELEYLRREVTRE